MLTVTSLQDLHGLFSIVYSSGTGMRRLELHTPAAPLLCRFVICSIDHCGCKLLSNMQQTSHCRHVTDKTIPTDQPLANLYQASVCVRTCVRVDWVSLHFRHHIWFIDAWCRTIGRFNCPLMMTHLSCFFLFTFLNYTLLSNCINTCMWGYYSPFTWSSYLRTSRTESIIIIVVLVCPCVTLIAHLHWWRRGWNCSILQCKHTPIHLSHALSWTTWSVQVIDTGQKMEFPDFCV